MRQRPVTASSRFVWARSSAGGLENARLLLLSGDTPRSAPGNAHDQLDRYFSDHAFFDPGTLIPSDPERSLALYFPCRNGNMPEDAYVRQAFSLGRHTLEAEGLGNTAMLFHAAYEADDANRSPQVEAMLSLWDMLRGRGVPLQPLARMAHAASAPHVLARAIWRKWRAGPGRSPQWRLRSFCECEPPGSG